VYGPDFAIGSPSTALRLRRRMKWRFTTADAKIKLHQLYPAIQVRRTTSAPEVRKAAETQSRRRVAQIRHQERRRVQLELDALIKKHGHL
jgi:hypothetical protein